MLTLVSMQKSLSLCFLWQVWTIAVMFLSKKFRLLPHMFTLNLFLAQVSTLKNKTKKQNTVQPVSWVEWVTTSCQLIPKLFWFALQFLSCIGMIVWNFVVKEDDFILQILTFTLLSTSLYSAFVWTGMLHMQRAHATHLDFVYCPTASLWQVTFVLCRFDRTLPCAYEKIWGCESFSGHVGHSRLGVSRWEEMKHSWFVCSVIYK